MKQFLILLLCAALLLSGCGTQPIAEVTVPETSGETTGSAAPVTFSGDIPRSIGAGKDYVSRFPEETLLCLTDDGVTVNGGGETQAVFTSRDIVYYADRDQYDSGNPYGEGTEADKHTAQEADAHTVVNITAPGAYRIQGKLSAGQIRVDLGSGAYFDPEAVVELILDNADITCTVAPAIVFRNVYECDGNWSVDTASSQVDTTDAGANLVLEGSNAVSGSYVAKIYKDAEGEKKLWKQDGAIYSYMSLNVFGPGSLDLTAENEGLDTELHLTIYGGSIAIRSGNDGINTNEDGVSVTTIQGGDLHIIAGLGEEGDGIDSNGYLVINGGSVVSAANPAADAGLDSDLGSYIHGGTVIALGSTMDWAESDSRQVTMNLQFAQPQSSQSAIVAAAEDGTVLFAYAPVDDEVLGENRRQYQGAVISCPGFQLGESCQIYLGGTVTGTETGGLYTTVTGYTGGTRMQYSGTELGMTGGMGHPGGMGQMPAPDGSRKDFTRGEAPAFPGGQTFTHGERGQTPGSMTAPEGFSGERPELPEGETFPRREMPQEGQDAALPEATSFTDFSFQDPVNAFSQVSPAA